MKNYTARLFVLAGLIIAVGGFLLIDDYWVQAGVIGNAMTGVVLKNVPYRYVLLCSVALMGFGLFQILAGKNKT